MSLSALRWHPCLHCAGSITSILLSSSPALHRHHCPCCVGTLIALDLSPTLHPHCRYYCELASAPSRCNRDTSAYVALSLCSLTLSVVLVAVTGAVPWRLGLHVRPISRWWFLSALHRCHHPRCAGILASIVLLSFQALCWRCHQCCVGLFALITLALPPALQTNICPTKTQSQHVRACGVVVMVIVLACGFIAVPGIVPW